MNVNLDFYSHVEIVLRVALKLCFYLGLEMGLMVASELECFLAI